MFTLAVDRKFKKEGQKNTDFFCCVAFGTQANFAEKYLCKGMKICAVGEMREDEYTNSNGEKRHSFQLVVNEVEFVERKSESQEYAVKNEPTNAGFVNVPDDLPEGLPF